MLISFSVTNWQSFRNKATFSMLASGEKQHADRLLSLPDAAKGKRCRLVPVAAIYGGNASGKTKFFNALAFAKKFVTTVTQLERPIPREPFKLDSACAKQPSVFEFILSTNDQYYEFSFAVSAEKVIEEKLVHLKAASEKILYHRYEGKIEFPDDASFTDPQRIKFVAEGTRNNLLFLTNSVDQKIPDFQPIYNWFEHTLTLISPDSIYKGYSQLAGSAAMHGLLQKLDTGIVRLEEKAISLDSIFFPEELKTKLMEELPEGEETIIFLGNRYTRISVTKKNGELLSKKILACHQSTAGKEVLFEMKDESAGTLRLLDLLPVFLTLHSAVPGKNKVYFIDELDHSLHTLLTRNLLENYLSGCSAETRTQLIFTTHDLLLMSQALLRRDELWVTERDAHGCSSLISFAEYKEIRADKNIRKSYLQGRMGGIPKIFLS